MKNIRQVQNFLFWAKDSDVLLSGHTIAYNFNISLIVNCAAKQTPYTNEATAVLSIPWTEDSNQMLFPQIRFYAHAMHQFMRAKGSVLVHCANTGVRSACLILYYLMEYRQLRYVSALEVFRETRPDFIVADSFEKQLKVLDKWIAGGKVGNPEIKVHRVPLLEDDEPLDVMLGSLDVS